MEESPAAPVVVGALTDNSEDVERVNFVISLMYNWLCILKWISYYDTKKTVCSRHETGCALYLSPWLSLSPDPALQIQRQVERPSVQLSLNQTTPPFHTWTSPAAASDSLGLLFAFSGPGTSPSVCHLMFVSPYTHTHTHTHARVNCRPLCVISAPRTMRRRWCGERRTGSRLRRAGWGKLRKLTTCTWWGGFSWRRTPRSYTASHSKAMHCETTAPWWSTAHKLEEYSGYTSLISSPKSHDFVVSLQIRLYGCILRDEP